MPVALALMASPSFATAAEQVAVPLPPAAAAPATTASFLAMSDIHFVGQSGETCNQAGDETDTTLWAAAQAEAQRVILAEKPAFAIYLGDLPSHCTGHPDTQFTVALDGLANIAGTGTKLIYVPGNNDSLAGDYGPFTATGGTPLDMSTAWHGTPVLNARPGDMIDTANLSKGYYSVYAVQATTTAPALRVIALNTTIFTYKYSQNVPTYQADANAQLEWLNAQMKDARAKGDKVIIAMHVPPGTDGYGGRKGNAIVTMWNSGLNYTGTDPDLKGGWVQRTFLEIVAAYTPEIVGLLSSHTHQNEIRRLRDCSRKLPKLGAFTELDVAIPSITTDHTNNPSVKVFSYDDRLEWTENRTFYASGESGLDWATNPVWSFDRDNYPCPSCTTGDTLAARIAALDKTTVFNTSKNFARMMIAWLKVGAAPLPSHRMYMMSLDATCEVPD
jgi:sphingomyelin phosphodiesterase acid-like 3